MDRHRHPGGNRLALPRRRFSLILSDPDRRIAYSFAQYRALKEFHPNHIQATAVSRASERLKKEAVVDVAMYRRSVNSTNDWAKQQIRGLTNDDVAAGCNTWLFTCDEQTAGRGRGGKRFDSNAGTLTLTVVRRCMASDSSASPWLEHAKQLRQGVRHWLDAVKIDSASLEIKPPNDLLLNGSKVAGMLIETVGPMHGRWSIVGVGINVDSVPDLSDHRPPTAPSPGSLATTRDRVDSKSREQLLYWVVEALVSENS